TPSRWAIPKAKNASTPCPKYATSSTHSSALHVLRMTHPFAGSEKSDRIHSGNSGRSGVTSVPPVDTVAASRGEGKDAGHAQAARDPGAPQGRALAGGSRQDGGGLRAKRPPRRG